jgi:hypothetical protein
MVFSLKRGLRRKKHLILAVFLGRVMDNYGAGGSTAIELLLRRTR